jgi:hypothetical protein
VSPPLSKLQNQQALKKEEIVEISPFHNGTLVIASNLQKDMEDLGWNIKSPYDTVETV